MAVPVVASSATSLETTGSVTTIDVAMPSGITNGDVLYVVISNDSSISTYSTPTGWTLEDFIQGSTAGCSLYLFSKRATGSEDPTITWTCSGFRYKNAVALRVTGVDSGVSDLTHAFAETEDTSTGTPHTSPSVATTETDCLILSAFCSDNTATDTWAAAGSETEVQDLQNPGFNGMALAVYSTDAASTGTYDHDVTQSPGGSSCLSMTWAIQAGTAAAVTSYHQLLGIGG